MAPEPSSLRRNIAMIGAWALFLPAIACWPFLSAMPVFAMLGGGSPSEIATQSLFFLTGFWPLALVLLTGVALARATGTSRNLGRANAGMAIGAYAFAWTILYGIAAFAFR